MIRYEYTYFVCFQNLPEHATHFARPSFQSHSTTFRDSATHRTSYMSYRDTQSQYQVQKSERRRKNAARDAQSYQSESIYDERDTEKSRQQLSSRMPKTSGGKSKGSAMQLMRESIDMNTLKSGSTSRKPKAKGKGSSAAKPL